MESYVDFNLEARLYQPLEQATPIPSQSPQKVDGDKPGEVMEQFGNVLKNYLHDVNKIEHEADKTVQAFALGDPVDLHQVMVAVERADMAMQLTSELRNKMIQAYQEITRMPV